MGTPVAFFDLDRTLLAKNSAAAWLVYELRRGRVGLWNALRASAWLVRYSLGTADVESALVESIATQRGRRERDIDERTRAFYASEVRAHFRPGGRRAVAEHRAHGERVVLLTSSSKYLSRLVAEELSLDAYLCTLLEVDDAGLFTGKPMGRVCFGEGKLVRAEAFAREAGVALGACSFYTDSAWDLPVLEVVRRAVAVNPDPRLARVARARGWDVVDWGTP